MTEQIQFDGDCANLLYHLKTPNSKLRQLIAGYYYFLNYSYDAIDKLEVDAFNIIHFDNIQNVLLHYPLNINGDFLHTLVRVLNNFRPLRRLPHRNLTPVQSNFISIVYLNILLKKLYDGIHNKYNTQGLNSPIYNKINIQTIIATYIDDSLNNDPFGINLNNIHHYITNDVGAKFPVTVGHDYDILINTIITIINIVERNNITNRNIKTLYTTLYNYQSPSSVSH